MTGEKTIIVAQCTDTKRSATQRQRQFRARDLYDPSQLFRAQRRYADTHADEWYILSARYGLIPPSEWVETYDMEISEAGDLWQERLLDQVDDRLNCSNAHVEVIAGGDYLKRLSWYLDHYDIDYSAPFDGMRYAIRIKEMRKRARAVENASLSDYD